MSICAHLVLFLPYIVIYLWWCYVSCQLTITVLFDFVSIFMCSGHTKTRNRLDVALSMLPAVQDMNNEIWDLSKRLTGPIAGTKSTDASKILLIELHHYATNLSGRDLISRGMLNHTQENSRADGYGCIQVHYEFVKELERRKHLPKGAYANYCDSVIHLETTTALEMPALLHLLVFGTLSNCSEKNRPQKIRSACQKH